MNNSDLIGILAKAVEVPVAKAQDIVDAIFDTMAEAIVSGDRTRYAGSVPLP